MMSDFSQISLHNVVFNNPNVRLETCFGADWPFYPDAPQCVIKKIWRSSHCDGKCLTNRSAVILNPGSLWHMMRRRRSVSTSAIFIIREGKMPKTIVFGIFVAFCHFPINTHQPELKAAEEFSPEDPKRGLIWSYRQNSSDVMFVRKKEWNSKQTLRDVWQGSQLKTKLRGVKILKY